jgi:hypothetical protein
MRPNQANSRQDEIVGLDLLGALSRCHVGLVALNGTVGAGDLTDDLTNDLVLDEEDVGYLAIEPIGPNMGAGLGVYELRRDAEVVFGALDTAFEYVAHPELATELGDVHGLTLVLEGGVAREHA